HWRQIIFGYGLENLVPDSAKKNEPNSLFKPHLCHLFLVLQRIQLLFDQPFAETFLSRQHLIIQVVPHVVVKQKQRISCRVAKNVPSLFAQRFGRISGQITSCLLCLGCRRRRSLTSDDHHRAHQSRQSEHSDSNTCPLLGHSSRSSHDLYPSTRVS